MKLVEAVAMEEMVVHEDASAEPAESPAPSAPATASAEIKSQVNSRTPTPSNSDPGIVEPRPRIKRIPRAPEVTRIVYRNVNHLRIGRLNLDCCLAVLI